MPISVHLYHWYLQFQYNWDTAKQNLTYSPNRKPEDNNTLVPDLASMWWINNPRYFGTHGRECIRAPDLGLSKNWFRNFTSLQSRSGCRSIFSICRKKQLELAIGWDLVAEWLERLTTTAKSHSSLWFNQPTLGSKFQSGLSVKIQHKKPFSKTPKTNNSIKPMTQNKTKKGLVFLNAVQYLNSCLPDQELDPLTKWIASRMLQKSSV